MPRKKKKEDVIEFWKEMVEIFFSFCKDNFGTKPSFDGSAPRDMKVILIQIRKRTEERNIGWTLDVAVARWRSFLSFAYKDDWLRSHWTLGNINRQKDALFLRAASLVTHKKKDTSQITKLPDQNIYDLMD